MIVRIFSVIGVLICLAAAALLISRSTTFQLFGEVVDRVDMPQKRIALTFDDGPAPKHLPSVLKVLREKNVRATFFLVGQAVRDHPEATRAIFEDGHEIGNHSFTHPRMVLMRQSRIAAEIEDTDRVIRQSGYEGPLAFRPPYGKKLIGLPLYLSRHQRPSIMWDIAPEQWDGTIPERIERVVQEARGGSIILLHVMYDASQGSRDMIGPLIDALHKEGFTFVTLASLLAQR